MLTSLLTENIYDVVVESVYMLNVVLGVFYTEYNIHFFFYLCVRVLIMQSTVNYQTIHKYDCHCKTFHIFSTINKINGKIYYTLLSYIVFLFSIYFHRKRLKIIVYILIVFIHNNSTSIIH